MPMLCERRHTVVSCMLVFAVWLSPSRRLWRGNVCIEPDAGRASLWVCQWDDGDDESSNDPRWLTFYLPRPQTESSGLFLALCAESRLRGGGGGSLRPCSSPVKERLRARPSARPIGNRSERVGWVHPEKNTAMVDAQPTRPIAKLGLVGEGGVVHLPASCCSFLMDASEYIEDGLFAVPFSVAALRVVEAFCSTPIQVSSRPASRHGTPQLLRSRKPERMPCRVRRSSKPPWRGQRAPGLTRCPTLSSSS